MDAPLPLNEPERLRALRDYAVLDTPPEAAFDRLVRLAAHLLQVPIVLISLVDENRQWFKACFGLDARQTERKLSFCAHAILTDDVFVVPDAALDARFADNPAVTGPPHVRFYAGAPLKTPGGLNLGTVCAVDTVPRQWSDEQSGLLEDMAAMVVDELELRRAARQVREEVEERRRTEENYGRLAFFPEIDPNPIVEVTREGEVAYLNPAAARLFPDLWKLGIEHPLLAPVTSWISAMEAEGHHSLVCEAQFGDLVFQEVVTFVPQNHRARIMCFDITDAKRAEQSLRESEMKFRAVVQAASDAVVLADENDHIILWNRGAEKIFGYNEAEILGEPFSKLLASRSQLSAKAKSQLLAKTVELFGQRKDGAEFPLELSLSSWNSGHHTFYSSFMHDITERSQSEAAIRFAIKEAEKSRKEAEKANYAKSDFLSRMSHELRTPMNAILGFGQVLEMDQLDANQRQSVEYILKAGEHLLKLINEVLDISRIEAGHLGLSPEPVSVREVLQEAMDMVRPLCVACGVRLIDTGVDDFYVRADRQRLKQVIINLLSNATKYNVMGGSITLSTFATAHGRIWIRVADTGGGIPEEKLERLFRPFDRLDAESTGIEGTGLGLALSQRLAEAMGGRIEVQSEVGRGTTFSVELARAADPMDGIDVQTAIQNLETQRNSLPENTFKVLYIEDNLSNLKLIETLVSRRPGIQLESAMDGRLGLEMARHNQPDLVLLDLHLPGMMGDEVLNRLKEDDATRRIPIIMMSADATVRQKNRLLAAGAREYLTKPIDVRRFLDVLDENLKKKAKTAAPSNGAAKI